MMTRLQEQFLSQIKERCGAYNAARKTNEFKALEKFIDSELASGRGYMAHKLIESYCEAGLQGAKKTYEAMQARHDAFFKKDERDSALQAELVHTIVTSTKQLHELVGEQKADTLISEAFE